MNPTHQPMTNHQTGTTSSSNQLVLHDQTLRVLLLLLPHGHVAQEINQARDLMNGGHLSVAQVRDLADLLARPSRLVRDEALDAARANLAARLAVLDLDTLDAAHRCVSVFVWDPKRDEPRRAIDEHDV